MRRSVLSIIAATAVMNAASVYGAHAQDANACPGPGFMIKYMLCVTTPPRRPPPPRPKPGPSLLEVTSFLGDGEFPPEGMGVLTEDMFSLQEQSPSIADQIRSEVAKYDPVGGIKADHLYIYVPEKRLEGMPSDLKGLLLPGADLLP